MIKFTSNVFSLLVISGIALLVQAVLGAADTDDDGSLLFDPSGILPPAGTLGASRAVGHNH